MNLTKFFSLVLCVILLSSFIIKNPLVGIWVYDDKEDPDSESYAGYIFTDSTITMFMSLGGGLDPIPLKTNKYIISKNKILIQDSLKTDTMFFKVNSKDLLELKGVKNSTNVKLKKM